MEDKVEVLDPPAGGAEGAPADSPPPPDDAGDSSTPSGDQPPDSPPAGGGQPQPSKFDQALDGLKSDEEAPDSPPGGDKPGGTEKPGDADEPAPDPPKPDDLSHEVEKAFNERPEWKGLLAIAGKDAAKAKPLLRQIFQRETALGNQVKALKPDAELGQRIKRATRDETATANAVALVEAWFAGKPEALGMLQELQSDLETRLGQRLTSPDLVEKSKRLDAAVEQLELTAEEAAERKADLIEVEKARAAQKRAEGDRKQTEQERQREAVEQLIEARTVALNDWERLGPMKNPDYARPEIRQRVIQDAQQEIAEREAKLGRMLSASEMVAAAQKAYDDVMKFVNGLQPKRRPETVPPNGGSSRTAGGKKLTFSETLDSAAEVL